MSMKLQKTWVKSNKNYSEIAKNDIKKDRNTYSQSRKGLSHPQCMKVQCILLVLPHE